MESTQQKTPRAVVGEENKLQEEFRCNKCNKLMGPPLLKCKMLRSCRICRGKSDRPASSKEILKKVCTKSEIITAPTAAKNLKLLQSSDVVIKFEYID